MSVDLEMENINNENEIESDEHYDKCNDNCKFKPQYENLSNSTVSIHSI
jgi:hypothetical protein